jgi:hypothetical protein
MCFQVYFKPSHRLKGKWSLRRRQRLPLHSIKLLILHRRSAPLSVFGIIFTHILFAKGGASSYRKGLIFHSSIRFWRFMPKGEKVLAQSKRTAPPPNFKIKIFKLISYCVQKGEKVLVSSKKFKTLLNTKRRISLRGSFVLVKGKAFETGGENFKS